jgi:dTMP kinase
MVGGGRRMSAYGSLLRRNRNYRTWFGANFFAGIADWTGLFALQVLVTTLTEPGSRLLVFALGGIMMARLLPSLILGPVAGVLADRYDRRRLMVSTSIGRGLLYIAVAASQSLVALFSLVFIVESMTLLFLSSKDASLPRLVRRDHLTQANQLNLLVSYGTLPLGAGVATVMIPVAGLLRSIGWTTVTPPVVALGFTAAAFVTAGLLLSRLHLPADGRRRTAASADIGMLEELSEGLRFIRDLPLIRALILGVIGVFFAGGAVITLGPAFVATSLGGASADWFMLMTFLGVGLVIGVLLVPALQRYVRKERAFPIALALTALTAGATATLDSLQLAFGFGTALGIFTGMSFVMGYTLLHEYTRDEVRARTFATFYTATRIALFASLALTPFLAGAVGRGTVILGTWSFTMSGIRLVMLAAAIVALISAWAAGRGMFAALRASEQTPTVRLGPNVTPSRSGLFVAFEGVEGAGKSTQIARLAEQLKREGHEVVVTREPGGSPAAERIRSVLLDPDSAQMDPRTEALLYAAARADHVQQVILPALEDGKVVLCDRFLDSSLAYQGYARGLGIAEVFEINRWAIGGLLPDVVILLYIEADEGLERVARRAQERGPRRLRPAGAAEPPPAAEVGDRMERETAEFHRAVGKGFLKLAKRERRRFRIVDATADPDTVARQVRLELHSHLPIPGARPSAKSADRPEAAG